MKQAKENKGLIIRKTGKKITVFDPDESTLYTLNETAAFIFRKLQAGKEKEEIITLLTQVYNVSETRAAADINEVLAELTKIAGKR